MNYMVSDESDDYGDDVECLARHFMLKKQFICEEYFILQGAIHMQQLVVTTFRSPIIE